MQAPQFLRALAVLKVPTPRIATATASEVKQTAGLA